MTKRKEGFNLEVVGKARWAKVFEHNRDMNEAFHGPGGAYTVDILLEKEELDKVSASGSRIKPRITDDGLTMKFKRKHDHPAGIADLGGPPKVVDAEGNTWDSSTLIGNDSTVKLFLDVYDTKMGKGTRLVAVQVLELEELPPLEEKENTSGKMSLPF